MIISNLNALAATFAALQCLGLVNSKADFSRRFLGKGASYLSSMQARTRRVPDVVLAMLDWSLQRELLSYAQNPHLRAEYAIRLNSAYSCIEHQLRAVRLHRAALAELSKMYPANDFAPAAVPPQDMQLVIEWVGDATAEDKTVVLATRRL